MESSEEYRVEPYKRIHHKQEVVRLELVHWREMPLVLNVEEHAEDLAHWIQQNIDKKAVIKLIKEVNYPFFYWIWAPPFILFAGFQNHIGIESICDNELFAYEAEYLSPNNKE